MVWYIRFLNAISEKTHDPNTNLYKYDFVLTITTDLGDEFYPASTDVHIHAITEDGSKHHVKKLVWKAGMRVLRVEFIFQRQWTRTVAFGISVKSSGESDGLQVGKMLEIVGIRSTFLTASCDGGASPDEAGRVFSLGEGNELCIWEELGESIARHIWDAGLALVAYIRELMDSNPSSDSDMPFKKLMLSSTTKPLNILELGSGCGIAGIALSQSLPNCNVLLTDLPEAMKILEINIKESKPKPTSSAKAMELDWDNALPVSISEKKFDLILISDCTYNADSLPALVRTVSSLILLSKTAHVIVSMKVRHDSEAVFFELMSNAGLEQIRHDTIKLPDGTRYENERPLEKIEIYDFQLQDLHSRP